jgi:hypothetical protein
MLNGSHATSRPLGRANCTLPQQVNDRICPTVYIANGPVNCCAAAHFSEYRKIARHYQRSTGKGFSHGEAEAFSIGRLQYQGGAPVQCEQDAPVHM